MGGRWFLLWLAMTSVGGAPPAHGGEPEKSPAAAEAQARARLADVEAQLGHDHPDVAEALVDLGTALDTKGDYEGARAALERALAIDEKMLGGDDIKVARIASQLGKLLTYTGDYATAEPLLERALAIAETKLGPDSPKVALSLVRLGNLRRARGDYAGTRALYERALAIQEKTLGPEHQEVAMTLSNLGALFNHTGNFPDAQRAYERSLTIREHALGPDDLDVSKSLYGLANALNNMGRYAEARPLFERVIAISRKQLGPDHPIVAIDLTALANLLTASGDLRAARPLYEEAIGIWERALGPQHRDISYALSGLGDVLRQTGERRQALLAFERALAIDEQVLGPDHPRVAKDLDNLAQTLAEEGKPAAAFDQALRAETISRGSLELTAQTLSEREALSYAADRVSGLGLALHLAAESGGAIPHAGARAWDALVHSRALILDEMAERHRTAVNTADPEVAKLAAALGKARERLAHLVIQGPEGAGAVSYRESVDQARADRESAERALAAQSAGYRRALARSQAGLSEVVAALPVGSALVAYARATESYLVLILESPSAEPQVLTLGPPDEIDRLVAAWRSTTSLEAVGARRPAGDIETESRKAGEGLRAAIWDPVARHLRGAVRVFVVPDGALHLVSFAALPAAGDSYHPDSYVIESGPLIHYLSAERDLVHQADEPTGAGLLVLGGPDFDGQTHETAPAFNPRKHGFEAGDGALGPSSFGSSAGPFRGARSACSEFMGLRFSPLRGATRETEDVANFWNGGGSKLVLVGGKASESAFKRQAAGRRVLHLATHAFFIGGDCASVTTTGAHDGRRAASPPMQPGENPLLLSGLALAGANRRAKVGMDEEDGVLTAEEIAALDLQGVEWAVLSACDTGVGEVQVGEGVLGLRRAFEVAGARTVIMSLWPVDDRATRSWMRALYDGRFARDLGTPEAVRAASLELLRDRRAKGLSTHPYYWAGFIAAGSWD